MLIAWAVLMVFEPSTCDVWFLPVVLTAILISPTLLEWLTGRREFMDVEGLISALLFQFMVVAPTLSFIVDKYSIPMLDTRVLQGKTMAMCLPGLIAFLLGKHLRFGQRMGLRAASSVRVINTAKASILFKILIPVGLAAHILYSLTLMGRGITWATRFSTTTGLGYITTIENLMYIGILLFAVTSIQKYYNRLETDGQASRAAPFFVFAVVFIIIMEQIFLQGSRDRILMYTFWMMGMIHFCLKRIRLVYLIIPFILGILFLHIYFLYKAFGSSAWRDYFDPARRASMEEASGGTMYTVFVGDLGRVGVWMFANQEISSGRFEHTWGKTYAEGSVVFIPRAIWPNRPNGMAEVITDMVSGKGAYQATTEKTARVTGLIGEAYINFGWPFVIIVMLIYGVIVRAVSIWVQNLPDTAAKAFWAPFLTLMVIYLFMWDWVWIVFRIFSMAIPIYIIYRMATTELYYEQQDEYYLEGQTKELSG